MRSYGLVAIALAAALSGASGALGQVLLDVSTVTCDQFIKYKVADPKLLAIWLNGYFHGKRGNTTVDTQKLDADADKVEKFCFANPQAPLMQSVESVLGSGN